MEVAQKHLDPVLQAFAEKHHSILVSGSNIFDLQIELNNDRDIFYRPYYAAEKLFEQGYYVLRYSRSGGFSIHRYNEIKNKSDFDDILKKTGLQDFLGCKPISPTEVIEIFRGFKKVAEGKYKNPFTFIVDYMPHLSSRDSSSNEERIVAETLNDLTFLPKVKKSGNLLLVYAHEECNLSSLLKGMYKVNYGYPSLPEYEHFINIISNRDEYANPDLDYSTMAKLCRGLTLSQIDSIFKAAKVNNQQVTKEHIIAEKERLIEQISEGTLKVLPTNMTFDDMAGLDVVKKVLSEFAEKLSKGSSGSPRALLLAGPPGTGKSTIVNAFANACGFNLVELSDSIKSKWVGESEARLDTALSLIESLAPVVLMIDEIDQQFSSRSQTANDGGVEKHYLKTVFKFAARDDLRGKICIVGCSNTPQLLDPAMIDRFKIVVPLLEATPTDIARIFPKIEKRILGQERLNPQNAKLLEGAQILFKKGASPRQIFDIITRTIIKYGENFNEEHILESCKSYRGNGDLNSGAFSSLSAINLTAFDEYLPWANNPQSYTYPWYLESIVEKRTGQINEMEFTKRLNEFAGKSRF
jgi:AAA+ superfamily predicted ATPase